MHVHTLLAKVRTTLISSFVESFWTLIIYTNAPLSLSCVVCRDLSCNGGNTSNGACYRATIPYVVGPSCTSTSATNPACFGAQISSAVSSCKDLSSCRYARIADVDLINSCNNREACQNVNRFTFGAYPFDELIDCCNEDRQCNGIAGLDIVNAGCVSRRIYENCDCPSFAKWLTFLADSITIILTQPAPTSMPSQSSAPSDVPSQVPSKSNESPSQQPSEVPSHEPSLAPSNSPRVTSVTFVERNGDVQDCKLL